MKEKKLIVLFCILFLSIYYPLQLQAQHNHNKKGPTPTLGLNHGFLEYTTPDFTLKLVKDSQTIAALKTKDKQSFDFTPTDWLDKRNGDAFYHLGDIMMRLKEKGADWKRYSTAAHRSPIQALKRKNTFLAGAILNPTLSQSIPLQVKRYWQLKGGHLVLDFRLKNTSDEPVEIGGLGVPMVFNNIITGRDLEEAHHKCVFYDPYIGEEAGYLQVTRLNGHGPSLLVVPEEGTKTSFEAYKPLLRDRTRKGNTFEGFYEWMIHTKAYNQNEWKKAHNWNKATAVTLQPGDSVSYGFKFLRSDSIQSIGETLAANDRPVAKGIPGYVLAKDQNAQLFINYAHQIRSMKVEPADALIIKRKEDTPHGWKKLSIRGNTWGRARLELTYDNRITQSINYKVIKPEQQVADDLGHFTTTKQWFDKPDDPFHRNPSPITYDYEKKEQVTQESRAWIAGLSDEGGAGSWLTAITKQLIRPDKQEIAKLEQFVDKVLWGGIQYDHGDKKYGVRKSMFYYQPDSLPSFHYDDDINFDGWASWNKKAAKSVGRSYNYTHVAVAYWVLYRLARNHQGLVSSHPWQWYLNHAYETTRAMMKMAPYYARFGQMEGTVFLKILLDLQREGWHKKAQIYEKMMRKRADIWDDLPFPFGSEMPWDSTGQEEVFAWCNYFGLNKKAKITFNAIMGYMPTVPHWAYNGNARRYWDFLYAGKLPRIERQIHHYGSGLNAIPVLTYYRSHPDDYYALRVGYGGLMGAISNVTKDGFGPAAFHAYPSTLKIDGYSGDYGPGFFGHAINTGTYIIDHPEFGWLAFGGNVNKMGDWLNIKPLDSARSRLYLAPVGLWLTLDAGKFDKVQYNTKNHKVKLKLAGSKYTSSTILRISQPAKSETVGTYRPIKNLQKERKGYQISFDDGVAYVDLKTIK